MENIFIAFTANKNFILRTVAVSYSRNLAMEEADGILEYWEGCNTEYYIGEALFIDVHKMGVLYVGPVN
jgi:hypothetical protein